jgi:predicted DNA-binding transcriptional regulator YafY
VDRVTSVEPTGDPVVRPPDFDLAHAWRMITAEVDERRAPVRARALVEPRMVALCRHVLGTRLQIGPTGPDGRVDVELRGFGIDALAGEIAGFGAAVEVVDPPELRARLARIGAELSARYGD